jgi:hypothetical protein
MTRAHINEDIPAEVEAFREDINRALANDHAHLTIRETRAAPGTEPTVTVLVEGFPLFHFRRDEFLEAIYVAGLGVMADLERAGLPLTALPQSSGIH